MEFAGSKVGVWLGNPLTDDGVEALKEMLSNPRPNAYQLALHEFWSDVYSDYLEGWEPPAPEMPSPQLPLPGVRERASRGPNTPGYNTRLFISFTTDRSGKPLAYYWSGHGAPGTLGRWIRMPLDEARDHIAQGNADQAEYTRWAKESLAKSGVSDREPSFKRLGTRVKYVYTGGPVHAGTLGTIEGWLPTPYKAQIRWDNGTMSSHTPDEFEVVPRKSHRAHSSTVRDFEGMSYEEWLQTARSHNDAHIHDNSVARLAYSRGVDPEEFVELYGGFALEEGGSSTTAMAQKMAYDNSGSESHLLRALIDAGALVLRAYPAPTFGLATDGRQNLLQIHVRFPDGTIGYFSPGGPPRLWTYRFVEGTKPGDTELPGVVPGDIARVTTRSYDENPSPFRAVPPVQRISTRKSRRNPQHLQTAWQNMLKKVDAGATIREALDAIRDELKLDPSEIDELHALFNRNALGPGPVPTPRSRRTKTQR